MQQFPVTATHGDYQVMVGQRIIAQLSQWTDQVSRGGEIVVITDDGVEKSLPGLSELQPKVQRIVLSSGEKLKTLAQAESLIAKLSKLGVSRDGMIIAFGGGVIGDLAGFVAAIYLRGIDWVVVPTTLLSQVDSAIGGKVAVNLPAGKNLVGAFHPPRLVVCDASILITLPEIEFISGLGEVIKTALIGDAELFELMENQLDKILARDLEILENVVASCVQVKSKIVSDDERDRGNRAVLNFGHTIAHALEAAEGFGHIPHGIAVLHGILAALPLSEAFSGLPGAIADRIRNLIHRLPIDWSQPLPEISQLKTYMERDKKVRQRRIQWVLLKDIGEPVTGIEIPTDRVQAAYATIEEP
jgi:3-dehydroquinate synthase